MIRRRAGCKVCVSMGGVCNWGGVFRLVARLTCTSNKRIREIFTSVPKTPMLSRTTECENARTSILPTHPARRSRGACSEYSSHWTILMIENVPGVGEASAVYVAACHPKNQEFSLPIQRRNVNSGRIGWGWT